LTRLVFAVLLGALFAAPPVGAEEALLRIEPIAEGVFAFRPTPEALDTWRAVSNSGAVVLDDGVLIYDSHWTPAHVEEATALLRQHTDKPIRYVVHSHYHGDHTGGAWAYGDDIEVISHHATRERLLRYFEDLPAELPEEIAGQERQLAKTSDPMERTRTENLLRYARWRGPVPKTSCATHGICCRGSRARSRFRCPA